MSVSFWSNFAPKVVVDSYECCDEEDCFHCNGSGVVEIWGRENEVNITNASARVVLDSLGLPSEELWGELEPEQIHRSLRRIMELRARSRELAKFTSPSFVEGNVYDSGMSEERLLRTLEMLTPLLMASVEGGWDISFG